MSRGIDVNGQRPTIVGCIYSKHFRLAATTDVSAVGLVWSHSAYSAGRSVICEDYCSVAASVHSVGVRTFLRPNDDKAARRRSEAPSKVYQWLGPRCRHKVTRKHVANRTPNFYRGSKSAKFGLDSQNQSPLTGSSFETEQHIGNLKHVSGA